MGSSSNYFGVLCIVEILNVITLNAENISKQKLAVPIPISMMSYSGFSQKDKA